MFSLVFGDADSSKNPRGIRVFQLDNDYLGEWKVQGIFEVGGYKK